MRIEIEKDKCTGCHLCEMVCSLFHLGVINPSRSAVRIIKDDLDTGIHTPTVCRQCKKMKCIEKEDVEQTLEKTKFIWKGKKRKSVLSMD